MARKRMVWLVVGVALIAGAASPAWATGGAATGQIINVTVNSSGIVFFSSTGTHNNQPACATTGRFAFSATTTAGQATLALLLSVYGLGRTVFVQGTGACDVASDSETVQYIETKN